MKSFRFLIVIPVLLLAIVMASASVLASTAEAAQFGATAVGPCVVGIGPSSASAVDYLETARGTFSFQGNAKVTPGQVGPWYIYAVEPGSVKAYGSLTATWSHEGQSYKFIASIYATDSTEGWVEPTDDWIIFGGSGGPYGCPLEYRGVLKAGKEITSIQGPCGLMVVNGLALGYPDMSVVVTKFIAGDISINAFWAEEAMSLDIGGGVIINIPATQVILDRVILRGY
jgi:hypothetical protein